MYVQTKKEEQGGYVHHPYKSYIPKHAERDGKE